MTPHEMELKRVRKMLPRGLEPLSLVGRSVTTYEGKALLAEWFEWQNAIRNAQQTASLKPLPEITFTLVDHTKINAFAKVTNREGLIGLHRGAVLLIHELFLRIFAHPETVPYIGYASAERLLPCHSESLARDYQDVLDKRGPGFQLEHIAPRDPVRLETAIRFARTALEFLSLHEIAHIAEGHCEFLAAKVGAALLNDSLAAASPEELRGDPMTRQALEMLADSYAADISLQRHTRGFESAGKPPADFDSRVYEWCFIVFCLFWIWGWGGDPNTITEVFYPPPACRSHAVVGQARMMYLDRVGKKFSDRFRELGNYSLANARHAMIAATGADALERELNAFYRHKEELLVQHDERIKNQWRLIAPELVQHSYVPLPI